MIELLGGLLLTLLHLILQILIRKHLFTDFVLYFLEHLLFKTELALEILLVKCHILVDLFKLRLRFLESLLEVTNLNIGLAVLPRDSLVHLLSFHVLLK